MNDITKKPEKKLDQETRAIRRTIGELESLDAQQRHRVVAYLADRFKPLPAVETTTRPLAQ